MFTKAIMMFQSKNQLKAIVFELYRLKAHALFVGAFEERAPFEHFKFLTHFKWGVYFLKHSL